MKNLLLFSTLLLTTASAFAQLTVKPNGAADSFMYVNDQIVFVTQEINLERNSTANDTEASIYLRNNGQLIQAETVTPQLNSGNGQLSVQQNSPVTNAWAYYYWCSPVGNPGTTLTATPNGNRSFGINFLYQPDASVVTAAQPVNRTTSRDGLTNTNPITVSTRWLYTFENPGTEREGNYKRMNGGNNAPPGYGFTMKGVGDIVSPTQLDQTYEFRGRPNSGTFSIPVAPPVGPAGQMTLAGNPYPSALDLNQLFYDAGNEELGEIWYYDEDRSVASHYYATKPFGYGVWIPERDDKDIIDLLYDGDLRDNSPTGQYVSAPFYFYNANGGGPPGGTQVGTGNTANDKRYAPIGQGLMFVGKTFVGGEDGFVNIRNSQRIFIKEDTPGSIFQRPNGDDAANEENRIGNPTISTASETVDFRTPIMRLWSIFDEAVTRDMVLAFYDQATDGYDRGLDGLSAQDLKTDAYFPIGDDNDRKPYVINGIKFDENKQVPIAFKLNKTTTIQLLVKEEIKKPYTHAYLFDSQENTYQNLSLTAARPSILNLPAGVYENRFFIVFRNPNVKRDIPEEVTIAKNIVMENVTFFQNNTAQQLEILNPEGYVIKTASVYDMSGKLVINEKNLGGNSKYSFYTGNLSDGMYLVKLMTEDDVAVDYKVIVHNK